jgi:predicted nucleic acid-binding protein
MIFLVNDANILIDLLKIGLIDSFFRLEYDFQVTDMVLAEVQEDNSPDLAPFIGEGSLTKKGFTFEELLQIQLLEVENAALSIADCSCLYYSKKISATLLTGDAALRRIAEQKGIPVHGMIWILDELVEEEIITKQEAREKLIELMGVNSRLPEKECLKRLRAWK